MRIGYFSKNDEGKITGDAWWPGLLAFISVELRPAISSKGREYFRIFTEDGGFEQEIGQAFSNTSKAGRAYIRFSIDSPQFAAPISANLYEIKGTDAFDLIWDRPEEIDNNKPEMAVPSAVLNAPGL